MPTAELVLSRFPRHLDVDQPGKVIGDVVSSMATPLDAQVSQIGKLRRAHRSGEAEQQVDVLRLNALHGFDEQSMVPVQRRLAWLLAADLITDPAPALDLLGLQADDALAPFPGEPDDAEARARLATAIEEAGTHDAWLAVARRVLVAAIADQRHHSTTATGLLGASADYLGFELTEVHHGDAEEGRLAYWHMGRCRDRLATARRSPPNPDGLEPEPQRVAGEHLLAVEENPPFPADFGPSARRHGAQFVVKRVGFDPVPCTTVIKGIDDRTVAPMVVDIVRGEGIATTVAVPAGSQLRFERDGRVELDGSSVASRSFVFSGAVFAKDPHAAAAFVFADEAADDDANAERFGDRVASYSVTAPLNDAFDPVPSFPHADALLRSLSLDRAESRFAVFVGTGTFAGRREADGDDVLAAPEPVAGFFDETVYEPDPAGSPSLEVGFEWDEREAYAVRVWLPAALAQLDVPGEPSLREVLRLLLDRHRAAGVHVYVEHADPRWVLGTGILRDLDSDDALGIVVAGTETWADDT